MDTENYKGWRNYETWLVFATEDQSNYYFVQDLAQAAKSKQAGPSALADQMKEYVMQDLPEMENKLYKDLLLNCFSSVDFFAIAEDFLR